MLYEKAGFVPDEVISSEQSPRKILLLHRVKKRVVVPPNLVECGPSDCTRPSEKCCYDPGLRDSPIPKARVMPLHCYPGFINDSKCQCSTPWVFLKEVPDPVTKVGCEHFGVVV